MKNKYLLPALLLLFISGSAMSQTKEKPPKEGKEDIIIRKHPDNGEKTTIVIDGDNITINGKPLSELKDSDIQVLRSRAMTAAPHLRNGMMMKGLDLRKLSENFAAPAPRPLLGVTSEKNERGAKITEVSKGSPAEKAGLQKDDIITRIDEGHSVATPQELYETITTYYHPGDKITVTYLRDGKLLTSNAILDKTDAPRVGTFNFDGNGMSPDFNFDMPQLRGWNNREGMAGNRPRLGIEIQDLEEGKGVKVVEVNEGSASAKAGLQKNDVITELDGKAVTSVDALKAQVREIKEGDILRVSYKRSGKIMNTEIKFPRKLKTADL